MFDEEETLASIEQAREFWVNLDPKRLEAMMNDE